MDDKEGRKPAGKVSQGRIAERKRHKAAIAAARESLDVGETNSFGLNTISKDRKGLLAEYGPAEKPVL